MDPKQYLIQWVEHFTKNKDVFLKSIISIYKNNKECDILIKHKHKEHFFFVEPFLKDLKKIIDKLKKINNWTTLVIVNNNNNLKIIKQNWKTLVNIGPKFAIYFVNPFSELDKKWIIFPSTHHKIADKESFEKGLKSMFMMVDEISEKEFLDKIQ